MASHRAATLRERSAIPSRGPDLPDVRVQSRQAVRGDPGIVEALDQEPAPQGAQHASATPAAVGNPDGGVQQGKASRLPQAAGELIVLQDGPLAVASQPVEVVAAAEDAGIAIEDAAAAAKAVDDGEYGRGEVAALVADVEGAAGYGGVGHSAPEIGEGAGFQAGIGVEEEKHVARGGVGPGVHLDGTAGGAAQQRGQGGGQGSGTVGGATVDDDHLVGAERSQVRQQAGEAPLLVQRRHDDGNREHSYQVILTATLTVHPQGLTLTSPTGEPRGFVEPRRDQGRFVLEDLWVLYGSLCDLKCKHCYTASSPSNGRLEQAGAEELRPHFETARRHAVSRIYFTGGEVFVNQAVLRGRAKRNEEFLRVLEMALDFAPVEILTNARRHI